MRRFLRRAVHCAICLVPIVALAACAGRRVRTADDECGVLVECPPARAGHRPIRVGDDPTVLTLARDLDHLERHIDWYGTAVAKVPDIWGQARLSQYRDEFEKAMANEVNNFAFGLQGTLSRSDSAYFASATALSFAAQPQAPLIGSVNSSKGNAPALVPTERTTDTSTTNKDTGATTKTTTKEGPPTPPTAAKAPDPVKPLDLVDPAGLVTGQDTVLGTRNAARLPEALKFGQGAGAVGIEPAEYLAQRKRHLDFLAQIRRENEGDDTADSPGYSLNLMRIPVSLLPGTRTDRGFGAEVTMTVTPVLGDDLLPMTFRNLLANDIRNQLGFPLTQILDAGKDDGVGRFLTEEIGLFTRAVIRLNAYQNDPDAEYGKARTAQFVKFLNDPLLGAADLNALNKYATETSVKWALADLGVVGFASRPAQSGTAERGREFKAQSVATTNDLRRAFASAAGPGAVRPLQALAVPSLSFSNGLDNRTAMPTSQILDVVGGTEAYAIGFGASQALSSAIKAQGYAHLPDIQSYLKEEAQSAYQFLEKNAGLWTAYCTPQLVRAIRSHRWDEVAEFRQHFRKEVALLTGSEPPRERMNEPFDPTRPHAEFSKTTALAWALIVDAALLTDRLMQDMKETATAKGKPAVACPQWCPFFLPDPPRECRDRFNEYVKLRWPVHVFALDPYVQEQNIADSLSTRREMQLALAIAFTNGQINARNMTKFVRRLEAEYQTIALNRTQVGFSHGENVFGWRFYPRFQSPDTKSNLSVFFREQLIGGPNRDRIRADWRLEPGERECVAVVMMPSFVPYVTVDTASNWFPLHNPKHKVLDTAAAVKLSQAVQTIKTGAPGVRDAACYRDGEFARLTRRAEQLEARLPLQTLTSAVPVLNTYGGFEMFSNGTTDLAPELFGWYGAPGIDPSADTTTLFLVGDHFSPLRTRVIVGNQAVDTAADPKVQILLSRQVMQVTFKKGAYPVPDDKGGPGWVRVHLATPYGVTRELEIPYAKQSPTPPKAGPGPGFSFGDAKVTANYGMAGTVGTDGRPTGNFTPVPQGADGDLTINWVAPGNTLTPQVEIAFEFVYQTATLKVPCKGGVIGDVKAKTVVVPKEEVARLANDLLAQIAAASPVLPLDANPLAKGLISTKVTIRPLAPGMKVQAVETTDKLRVEFNATGVCPLPAEPAPKPMDPPQKPEMLQMPRPAPRTGR